MKDFLYTVGSFAFVGFIIYAFYTNGVPLAWKDLPTPQGSYDVGLEVHTMKHNNASLWIWYPSNFNDNSYYDSGENPYGEREELKNFTQTIAQDQKWSVRFFAFMNRSINLWGSKSHAQRNVRLSSKKDQYPVIFLIPEGSTPPFLYSSISENLASHGFVVVGISDPQQSFGGDMVHESGIIPHIQQPEDEAGWTSAVNASLENCTQAIAYMESLAHNRQQQWYDRITLDTYGCCGFAWNGMVPPLLCHKDTRCKAGATINGWLDIELPQEFIAPLLIVLCEPEEEIYLDCVRESLNKHIIAEDSIDLIGELSIPTSNYCSFNDMACCETPLAHMHPKQEHPHAVLLATGIRLAEFFEEHLGHAP